tara:strand:+ start:161 stop:526 length:366 start_codon:yes stop_codon:yes gene_type:complete
MRVCIKIILAIAIFFLGAAAFWGLHIAITGDEPNYRVRGGGGLILFVGPWFVASWIVNNWSKWTRESAVGVARVGLKANRAVEGLRTHTSSVIEEAKLRETKNEPKRTDDQGELSYPVDQD